MRFMPGLWQRGKRGTADEERDYLNQELKKINARREGLFENFAEGILDEKEYQFAKEKYDQEASALEKKLKAASAKKNQLDSVLSFDNKWLAAMHEAENAAEMNETLVKSLINKVMVFEDNRVEVELNFSEDKDIFQNIVTEMAGDAHE